MHGSRQARALVSAHVHVHMWPCGWLQLAMEFLSLSTLALTVCLSLFFVEVIDQATQFTSNMVGVKGGCG